MKILVICDVHNDIEKMMVFIEKLRDMDFDVIVFPGDITDYNLPKGFTRSNITKLIIEELKTLGKPMLLLPGNQDKEIIPILELVGVSLHGRGVIIENVGFYGFGGAKTPFGTSLEPDDKEIERGLIDAYEDVKDAKIKVQVTHEPPARTKVDKLYTGAHVGN